MSTHFHCCLTQSKLMLHNEILHLIITVTQIKYYTFNSLRLTLIFTFEIKMSIYFSLCLPKVVR